MVVLGVALSLKASHFVFYIAEIDELGPVRNYVWPVGVAAVGSVASIVVGVAAYSAREWARRTLIAAAAVSVALSAVFAYAELTRPISALGQLQPQFVLWSRVCFVGEAVRRVSPPAFFLLILLHPDVVRSFHLLPREHLTRRCS